MPHEFIEMPFQCHSCEAWITEMEPLTVRDGFIYHRLCVKDDPRLLELEDTDSD